MNKVRSRRMIVPNMHLLEVDAPEIASKIQPGQFVIVRAVGRGERIPLSVADWDRGEGTLTIVFMEVGASTAALASLQPGGSLATCVGPLGKPTEIARFGTVLAVGGCYGIGSLFPAVRALKEAGNKVVAAFEARSSYLLYWLDRYASLADRVFTITRDGSNGIKGHVSHLNDVINTLERQPDLALVNGCTYLLRRSAEITKPFGIKTVVSLNPIMIDGTGMCGVCRVSVAGRTRFACVDGPEFDGHAVDWDELMARRKAYLEEETLFFRRTGPAPAPSETIHDGGRCQQ